MRVRDHAALSTASAALLYPWLRGAVIGPWAASILIDADHYLWFCLHGRSLNPLAAVRYFHQAQSDQHRGTRLLHSPAVLLLLSATRWRRAALGMAFHVGLDTYHRARTAHARAAAMRRDRFTCQVCGTQEPSVVAHLGHQPWLLPSYRIEHFTSLCSSCHEAAHARGAPSIFDSATAAIDAYDASSEDPSTWIARLTCARRP